MTELPDAVVGEAYASTAGWELLEELVGIRSRMPGHEGEREAAELIAGRLSDAGLEPELTGFPIPGWRRGDTALTVDGRRFDATHELVALPGTPAGDVTGELVDVGYGVPEDFEDRDDLEGAVVMASSMTPDDYGRWVHRGEKYAYAAEAGAAGFVFRNHVEGCLPPTGSVGDIDGPGAVPAVGVSKEVGERLRRRCADGTVEATLSIDAETGPATSTTVEASVGPETDESVLFTAHVDAHDVGAGANDNGVGCALVVEVGRILARIADDLETRVRLVVFGAEETGLYGSYYWTHTHELDDVRCVLNVDGAGYSRNLEIHTHGFGEIGDVFDAVSDAYNVPIGVESGIRPHSDHWPFVQRGCPAAQARSTSEGSGRGWGHTHGDTLDKLDPRDVRELSILCAAGVARLAGADRTVTPVPDDEVREATIDQGFDVGMKATDSWPWGGERSWPWLGDGADRGA